MGFTSILLIIVIVFAMIMIKIIINGIKEQNWKKVLLTAILFCLVLVMIYYGLISFITSM